MALLPCAVFVQRDLGAHAPHVVGPNSTDTTTDVGVSVGRPIVESTMQPTVLPAVHWRQAWKNVRVYVTADVPGTQAVGEMRFDDFTNECYAEYKFVAIYPAVWCVYEIYGHVDDDGDPSTPIDNDQDDDPSTIDNEDVIGVEVIDDLCDPRPDRSNGRLFGSGINPEFKTRCDPDLGYCVLVEKSLAEP